MTKQKLFELSEKINVFTHRELGDELIVDVAAAMIFTLTFQASQAGENNILPESICSNALIALDKLGV